MLKTLFCVFNMTKMLKTKMSSDVNPPLSVLIFSRQSLIYHLNKFHPSVDVNEILSVQSKYKCPECPLEFMTLLRKEDHYIAVHNARGQTEVLIHTIIFHS